MLTQKRIVDAQARVILPEKFIGKTVTVDPIGEGEIRIRVIPETRRRPSLASLLAGVPEDYCPDEIDFGPSVGGEVL